MTALKINIKTFLIQSLVKRNRRLDLFLHNFFKVDICKERMSFNLLCIVFVPKTLLRLHLEEPFQKRLCLSREIFGNRDVSWSYVVYHLGFVVRVKRWFSRQHIIQKRTLFKREGTKLNQSAVLVYPFPLMTSGATYYGVPQTLKVTCFCEKQTFDKPKSVNLMCPSWSSKMFSGLRSL